MKIDLFLNCIWNYLGESKVLLYFGSMRHNSVAPDGFAKIVKVMNLTGLWDAELAWYSPSATHQIHLYGLEHNLKIHSFSRPIWALSFF